MDPLVESLRHAGLMHPDDHSLDGLPTSWIAGAFLLVILISIALAAAGRSWGKWHLPAAIGFCVWWSGVMFGRGQPGGGSRLLSVVTLGVLVISLGVQLFRAALEPRPK
jgi:hypothetical protein